MTARMATMRLAFVWLLGSTVALNAHSLTSVYADSATTAADSMTAFQTKLDQAMHDRPDAYTLTYAGPITEANLTDALTAVYAADAYLLYSTKSFAFQYTSGATSTVTYSFTYWETLEQTRQVSDKVTAVLRQILTPGMNDFQKEQAIHDWIVKNLSYDTTKVQHSAYAGLFNSKKTVCQGYTMLAYKMLQQAGIENRIIEGTAGGELHTWNLVKINGAWYHLDTTWDDPLPDVPGRVAYDYYNLTDEQLQADHEWDPSTYPAASVSIADTLSALTRSDATHASYYTTLSSRLGLPYLTSAHTAANSAQLAAQLSKAMDARQPSFTVRYTAKATLAADLKNAISRFDALAKYSYTYSAFTRTPSPSDVLLTVNLTYRSPATAALPVLKLNQTALKLKIKGQATLVPSWTAAKPLTGRVTWTSSNTAVATVSSKGVVTAKSAGTAKITVKTADGKQAATAIITVVKA